MRATCYVIWTDSSRNYFTLFYEEEETASFSSFNEFLLTRCLRFFPGRTREEVKWIIRD